MAVQSQINTLLIALSLLIQVQQQQRCEHNQLYATSGKGQNALIKMGVLENKKMDLLLFLLMLSFHNTELLGFECMQDLLLRETLFLTKLSEDA